MPLELSGRTALVIDGAGEIGGAGARALVQSGASVTIVRHFAGDSLVEEDVANAVAYAGGDTG